MLSFKSAHAALLASALLLGTFAFSSAEPALAKKHKVENTAVALTTGSTDASCDQQSQDKQVQKPVKHKKLELTDFGDTGVYLVGGGG